MCFTKKSFFLPIIFNMLYGCSSGIKITVHEFDKSLFEAKDTVVILTTFSSFGGDEKRTTLFANGKGITECKYTYGNHPSNKSNIQFPKESFKLLVKTFEMYNFSH